MPLVLKTCSARKGGQISAINRIYKFTLVDAFTEIPLGGNPCAVVHCADSLTEDEMLAIAKEMNQSETAFILKPKAKTSDLRARYFTPEREIPLAGHPTIATIHAALEDGILTAAKQTITLELRDGPIQVQLDRKLIRMFQRKPIFLEIHEPTIVLPMFSLGPEDLLPGAVIQTVSTGTPQLMVPLTSHDSLKKVSMQIPQYKAYRAKMNFFSPHFFCLKGIHSDATTFARHLGVTPDTMEDSFTGSATGGMAAYLWKYGLIASSVFIAEQGHWMGRPGRAFVEVLGNRDNIESVSVAGHAVSIIRGEMHLGTGE